MGRIGIPGFPDPLVGPGMAARAFGGLEIVCPAPYCPPWSSSYGSLCRSLSERALRPVPAWGVTAAGGAGVTGKFCGRVAGEGEWEGSVPGSWVETGEG